MRFWYYVRINGVFYKIKCLDSNFEIDEEVRVKIPNNNWNRMYIDFRKGTNTEYKRWVRPKEWLPLPKEVKSNDVYFLVKGQKSYNGQFTDGKPYTGKSGRPSSNYGIHKDNFITINTGYRYPRDVVKFKHDKDKLHPTQKPVALLECFIVTGKQIGRAHV